MSQVRMVGAKVVLFVSYYWEIHEDGKRAQWGFDSEMIGTEMNVPPKALEAQMQQNLNYDKLVFISVTPMGVEGGSPILVGGMG